MNTPDYSKTASVIIIANRRKGHRAARCRVGGYDLLENLSDLVRVLPKGYSIEVRPWGDSSCPWWSHTVTGKERGTCY